MDRNIPLKNINRPFPDMKKRYLTVALAALLLGSVSMTSCIGSFALTNRVLNWNKQVGSKFVNELVFFAFWVLPVYEVTSLADLLVINSIEFWSGNNPVSASTKAIDTDNGRYLVDCDGKGYTITFQPTGESYRLDFDMDTQTWSLDFKGESYPLMTMIDDSHVRMTMPDGEMRPVDLTHDGLVAYCTEAAVLSFAMR